MTRSKIKSSLKKEKEKASTSMIGLDLNLPYPLEITMKRYPIRYVAIHKFEGTYYRLPR